MMLAFKTIQFIVLMHWNVYIISNQFLISIFRTKMCTCLEMFMFLTVSSLIIIRSYVIWAKKREQVRFLTLCLSGTVLTSKLQIYEMKLGPILSYFHVEQYR